MLMVCLAWCWDFCFKTSGNIRKYPSTPHQICLQLKLKSATHQNKAGGKEGNGNAHDCPLRPGHLKSAVRLFSIWLTSQLPLGFLEDIWKYLKVVSIGWDLKQFELIARRCWYQLVFKSRQNSSLKGELFIFSVRANKIFLYSARKLVYAISKLCELVLFTSPARQPHHPTGQ